MNFHKTIGYLSALLLMVGLGVPDSFAQVKVIMVDPSSIPDNSEDPVPVTVTVEVKVLVAATAEETYTIRLLSADSDDQTNPFSTASGTFSDPVTVAVGKKTGTGTGTVVFTMNKDGVGDADPDPDKVSFTLSATDGAQNVAAGDGVKLTLTDHAAVLGDNALDASGFRVIIKSPGAGEWAGINRKVTIQLLRRATLASEWGNYQTIKVALRQRNPKGDGDLKINLVGDGLEAVGANDAARTGDTGDFYSLTIGGTDAASRRPLGTLILESVKTATLVHEGALTNIEDDESTSKVTYRRRSRSGNFDSMDFEFDIPELNGAPNLNKVYAQVTFTGASVSDVSISSHDTETLIYPGNPSAATEKVGDGKFIKLDRDKPAMDLFETADVTIVNKSGKPFTGANATLAIIGRYIRTEARLKTVFRDHSIKFQIVNGAVDDTNTGDVDEGPNPNHDLVLVGYEGVVEATDLFNSADTRAVIDSVKVDAGKFKLRYEMKAGEFEKGDTVEMDGMKVRVRISVLDAAGNEAEQQQFGDPAGGLATFTLDGKRPKITITYPDSAHHRFTEKIEQDITLFGSDALVPQKLNPLVFTSDEPLHLGKDKLRVIIGDDTLGVKAKTLTVR